MFNAVGQRIKSAFSYVYNGYDAVNPKSKRRNSGSAVRSTDAMLGDHGRRSLIESGRDLVRNFPIAAWAIRKHVDYVSTFSFEPNTGIAALDDSLDKLIRWWSLPQNCDVARRHSLDRMIKLAEMRRTVDGDVFLMKLGNNRLQAIEGDRVRNESGLGVQVLDNGSYRVNGVNVDSGGRARSYEVYRRSTWGGSYEHERTVNANRMLHLAYYDTFEQVRGVSPLASAIASYHDVLEMSEYARLKAKVSQFFSMTIARDAPEYRGLGESDCDSDYESQLRDFGKAPLILDLDPGDKAEFLESKTPSTEFQAFIQLSLQIALKSLDIPWSFLDESHTNYSGSRIATLQYIKSCESKRRDVELLLDQITYWIISNWVAQGVVELPGGMTMKDVKWKWIPAGTPWFNPAEEGQADIDLINAGLKTRTEVRLEKFGDNWKDVADRLKDEEEYINELNLKLTTGGSNSIDSGAEARATIVEESQETEDNTEEEEDNAENSA